MTAETELAWAAGFFDGEGSTSYARGNRNKNGTFRLHLRVHVGQKDLRPLLRFQAAMGGRGNIIHRTLKARFEFNDWSVQSLSDVTAVHNLLRFFISEPKREQILSAAAIVADHNRIKEGYNP